LRDLITTEIAERNNNVANRCETVALIRRVSRSLPLLGRASQVMDAVVAAARHKIRWNAVAAVFSISIVAVAALTLYNSLRQIDVATAIAALRSQSLQQVLIAGGFVASAYLTLSFYDVLALRAIGRKAIPCRTAALASFTSYTIGHNLGATVLTAGVIRYRLYSAWRLRVAEIGAIAFITSLTYWLGNAFVLGCGLLYAPEAGGALDRLPVAVNRLIGIAMLLALTGYFAWLLRGPRRVGRAGWRIVVPGPSAMLLQIVIASLDLVFGAAAMYVLLPLQPAIDFPHLLTIMVAAMLIGVVSHAPGSLGVIEATMFLGLPQFNKEALLASLLTFRIVYFVLPLFVAGAVLGLRESLSLMGRLGLGRGV
jgi:glycosyltransferase 2 family protein